MTHAVCLYIIYIIFYQYKDYFYIFFTMTRLVHTQFAYACVQSICALNLATFSRLIVTNLHHVDCVRTSGLAMSPVFNFSLFQQWYCDYLFVIPRTNTRQQTTLRGISTSSARTTHKDGSCSSFKQVQYGLRDEDLDYNHEMDDMESSSKGEESMDEDFFED